MLDRHPAVYSKLLSYIRAGAYLNVAAAAVGVSPETVSRWLTKGQAAKSGPFRRFYQDVLAAVAEAAVVTEAELRQSKPEVWLRCGPRRLLGDDWREDQQPGTVVNIDARPPENSHADIAAALLALQDAGIITINGVGTVARICEADQSKIQDGGE